MGASKRDTQDENKLDFDLIKIKLAAAVNASTPSPASTTTSSSSIASTLNSTGFLDHEIWPLQLNVVFLDHYIFGDTIGSGSYAEVRECVDTRTLQRCAVKIVNKHYLKRQAPRALLNQLQEIRLLRRFNCANIISMKECLFKGPKIYIFLEHCSFVLNDLLNEQPEKRFCGALCRILFKQLIAGLEYLHSIGIVHRDIKPQNLLISNCGTLKIIDFGVSQILSIWTRDDYCSNCEGSPLFQSPEVIAAGQSGYSGFAVDVWSAGVTLYLMLFGEYPFEDEALLGLYDKILSLELSFPFQRIKLEQEAVIADLLGSMLEKSSAKRATIESIQQHPWLNWSHWQDCRHCRDDGADQEICEHVDLSSLLQFSNDETSKGDVYKSMSVLPYLHNYHFPQLTVIKAKQTPSSTSSTPSTSTTNSPHLSTLFVASPSGSQSDTSTSGSSDVSRSSTPSDNSPSQLADPHQVIDERPVEWGTERQYKLLKVPQIRANRVRKGQRNRRNRKGRGKK